MPSRTIVVTGFGPFAGHEERNASWEAVKLLPDSLVHGGSPYALKKLQVPVTYESVDTVVPQIWAESPALVVHCGVHGNISTINLEKCSYSVGYCRPDFANKCLPCDRITLKSAPEDEEGGKCVRLETNLKVEAFARELSTVRCVPSTEVGNYLCGYIYLKSLDFSRDRTLFIHVPSVGKPYSSEQTKDAIQQVLERCLDQLAEEGKL
uniref:Putative pyroglutamyl-peptidase 1 n=1 Tax=Culex tarsalis TaxID=7177 RepID=A0A1Q3FH34_CULTA